MIQICGLVMNMVWILELYIDVVSLTLVALEHQCVAHSTQAQHGCLFHNTRLFIGCVPDDHYAWEKGQPNHHPP